MLQGGVKILLQGAESLANDSLTPDRSAAENMYLK
jgi:hypothetical protein